MRALLAKLFRYLVGKSRATHIDDKSSRIDEKLLTPHERRLYSLMGDNIAKHESPLTEIVLRVAWNARKKNPNPPAADESVAVVATIPKTAALCYDRIVCIGGGAELPPAIEAIPPTQTYAGQEFLSVILMMLGIVIGDEGYFKDFREEMVTPIKNDGLRYFGALLRKVAVRNVEGGKESEDMMLSALIGGAAQKGREESDDPTLNALIGGAVQNAYIRLNCESLWQECKVLATPIYNSPVNMNAAYREGGYDTIALTISHLNIVDESALQWGQVIEFRKDEEARVQYRRLIRWLDDEMIGKSQAFIADEIARRLDMYRWSLRKHGIQSVLGHISGMLDARVILGETTAAEALSFLKKQPLWSLLAAEAVIGDKTTVTVADASLDIDDVKRGPNSEVAYLYEVEKKLGSQPHVTPAN